MRLLQRCEVLLTRKNAAFTEFDVAVDPNWRAEMVQRANGGATFLRFSSTSNMSAAVTISMRSTAKANSMACSSGRKSPHDSQQRKRRAVHCGHGADAHRDVAGDKSRAGHRIDPRSQEQGADYVQTPEVTNIIQQNRGAVRTARKR
jgi:hypothetical protein